MYAIIQTGGKQLKVAVGDSLFIEKLDVEEGALVNFDKVLLVGGDKLMIGNPYVKGASVRAVVEKHGKGKKIVVFKFKAKTHYRKKQGHRQPYSKIKIEEIII